MKQMSAGIVFTCLALALAITIFGLLPQWRTIGNLAGPGAPAGQPLAPTSGQPVLALPSQLAPGSDGMASVPVQLTTSGVTLVSAIFSLDIDQACLVFDPVDADGNGRPDAVTFNTPRGFNTSVAYDATDTDGELDFVVADYMPPYAQLSDGVLFTVRLAVVCWPGGAAARDIPLTFAAAPALSFGLPGGSELAGAAVNGSIRTVGPGPGIAPNPTATPTPAAPPPTPGQTVPPPVNERDDDDDGLLTREEGGLDWDGDGMPNSLDSDDDGDGIPTALEGRGDADGNGLPNYLDLDSNDNSVLDAVECGPDPLQPLDDNNNGIWDYLEITGKPIYLPFIQRGE